MDAAVVVVFYWQTFPSALAQTSLSPGFSMLSLLADNTKIMTEMIGQSSVLRLPADILRGSFISFYCSGVYHDKMHLHE